METAKTKRKQCLVLIVEASVETYELYSEILASAGYAVIGADNGDDGLAMAVDRRPDLVVMDYDLVGIDGVEVTHRLKADPRTRDIPIVMMTGHVATEYVERARSSGCDAFLAKPCPLDKLLEEVESLVPPSQSRRGSILYVEDDEDIRLSLTLVLEEEGYRVIGSKDGREALRRLEAAAELPSVILLDLMMPIMDGWHFRQAQLANPRFAGIPVVILSAVQEIRTRNVDAAAFLAKPIDVDALLATIERTA